MCEELGVPYLGSLPLDPRIARCCDEGKDFLTVLADSKALKASKDIVASKILIKEYLFIFLINNSFQSCSKRAKMSPTKYRI